MMRFVRSIPIAICGLSLALAALGNLLLPHGATFRYICGALSVIVLIIFMMKVTLDWPHGKAELGLPVPLSVLPTSTMAFLLLTTYIRPYFGTLAISLWVVGIILHLLIMAVFFKRYILSFQIGNVFPSWFIPFVGFVVISVTAPAMGMPVVGQMTFYLGFFLYFVALVLILLKMSKPIFVLEPLRLTTPIFTAPMSLLMVGYFASFQERSVVLIYIMLAIALLSYLYVTFKMITTFLKIKFYPTYAAFTFPYVISAIAFRLGSDFLSTQGVDFFAPFVAVSEWIAIVIVFYVTLHFIRFSKYVLSF